MAFRVVDSLLAREFLAHISLLMRGGVMHLALKLYLTLPPEC